ncbi:hypothetical protein MVEN_02563900 [Mycena venus]|uniref:Uncharacterized protein n=1 Tax=Mycena venus TaxID=2733690 RepID=A0A8H6U4W4_9AGAR|nr:hypothetical protein MVEN_02563900 [Mycena venus]
MPLSLADLLNSSDDAGRREQALMRAGLVNIRPELQRLSSLPASRAPVHIRQHLLSAIEYLEAQNGSTSPSPPSSPCPDPVPRVASPLAADQAILEEHNVCLTEKTTLSKLYRYPLHTILEYPETSSTHQSTIGHLFRMDPDEWQVPDLNIVYSRGEPMGRTLSGKEVFFDVMVDGEGNKVPPGSETYVPKRRLKPKKLEKSIGSWFGEVTDPKKALAREGSCFVMIPMVNLICEHYDKTSSRDHFHDDSVGSAMGAYDLNYIQAVLGQDEEEVARIEEAAYDLGYGPRVECTTVTNVSSQRANCPHDHRDENGELTQPLMERLQCAARFRVIEPLEDYRRDCPYVLITSCGPHTHPIPLPTKTPPAIRTQIFQLLENLGDDIPDITPRRFLRHPIVKSFLTSKFPHNPQPTLTIEHLKQLQDTNLPACEHYIRRMYVLDAATMERHEEDDDEKPAKDDQLRIIISIYKAISPSSEL